jgi:hypothetical protein
MVLGLERAFRHKDGTASGAVRQVVSGFDAIRLTALRRVNGLQADFMLNVAFAEDGDGMAVSHSDRTTCKCGCI